MPKGGKALMSLVMAVALLGAQIRCVDATRRSASPSPNEPTIASFQANPATITAGASTALTAVFAHGTGVINPDNLCCTCGTAMQVTPGATTTYTLTVTNAAGVAVTETVGVTVVPPGAAILTPDTVQASGGPQTAGAFANAAVVGETLPATGAASSANAFQVRDDFLPPSPN